ncbi:hypothetical protein NMY22_g19121 [Coprinellus aureogranulatus]|nr:hypothetical protein NMY22_g19121 [Coprinellus aureogranulatus]
MQKHLRESRFTSPSSLFQPTLPFSLLSISTVSHRPCLPCLPLFPSLDSRHTPSSVAFYALDTLRLRGGDVPGTETAQVSVHLGIGGPLKLIARRRRAKPGEALFIPAKALRGRVTHLLTVARIQVPYGELPKAAGASVLLCT